MFGKIVVLSAVFLLKDEAILWILLLVSIIAFLDGWAAPIRQAMLPEFVGKAALPKANSLVAMSDNTVNLASWPLGAFFVTQFNGGLLILVTIALYIIGWLLTYGINSIVYVRKEIPSLKEQLTGGWRYSFSEKSIRNVLILDMLTAFAGAVWISAILYVYVDEVLGKNEAWWGYINAFYSGGFIHYRWLLVCKTTKGFRTTNDSSWVFYHELFNGVVYLPSSCSYCSGDLTFPWNSWSITIDCSTDYFANPYGN
jgi:hypothetical protein